MVSNNNGDQLSLGNITDSQAIAQGRQAIAISTTGDVTIYQGPGYERFNYRHDSDAIVAFYAATFVGRTAEVDWLLRRVTGPEATYTLVEAPAGYGKSAFIAQLIYRHQHGILMPQTQLHMLAFFIREEGQRNTPAAFLQALNSQLLDLLGGFGGVPTDLAALRAQFTQLWSQLLSVTSTDTPVILLIDGMDEMSVDEVTIAQLLPTQLTSGVHVVVTSRPQPEPLAQAPREHPLRQAQVLRLTPFQLAEIQALLLAYDVPPASVEALASRIISMTQGEPLFARFVCQDVAESGESVLIRLERNPPPDVAAYFQDQLEHLASRATAQTTQQVLGLLLVTLGAIRETELGDILALSPWDMHAALAPIRRFLLGGDILEYMHTELRRAVTAQFPERQRRVFQQQILTWCEAFGEEGWPDTTPSYVVEYYARHLVEAGTLDRLHRLFVDQRWLRLRVTRANGAYDRYLDDLMRAWKAAHAVALSTFVAGHDGAAFTDCIRYALIRASIHDIVRIYDPKTVALALKMGLWEPDRALSLLYLVGDESPAQVEVKLQLFAAILAADVLDATQKQHTQQLCHATIFRLDDRFLDGFGHEIRLRLPQGQSTDQQAQLLRTKFQELLQTESHKLKILAHPSLIPTLLALQPILMSDQAVDILCVAWSAALAYWHDELGLTVLELLFSVRSTSSDVLDDALFVRRALGIALNYEQEQDRARAIILIAAVLSPSQRAIALTLLLTDARIPTGYLRIYTLAALTPDPSTGTLAQEVETVPIDWITSHDLQVLNEAVGVIVPYASAAYRERILCATIEHKQFLSAEPLTTLLVYLDPTQRTQALMHGLRALIEVVGKGENYHYVTQTIPEWVPYMTDEALDLTWSLACTIRLESSRAHILRVLAPVLNSEQLAQGVVATEDFRNRAYQALVLETFACHLPTQTHASTLSRALEVALTAGPSQDRTYILERLAHQLTGQEQVVAVRAALDAASHLENDPSMSMALAAILPFLSGEEKAQALRLMIPAVIDLDFWGGKPTVLSGGPGQVWNRPAALREVLPHLSRSQIDQVYAGCLAIEEDRYRINALAVLAPYLTDIQRASLLAEALAIDIDWRRGDALAELAPHLTEQQVQIAFYEADTIGDPERRARARVALATYLPPDKLSSVQSQLLDEALPLVSSYCFWFDEIMRLVDRLPSANQTVAIEQIMHHVEPLHHLEHLTPYLDEPQIISLIEAMSTLDFVIESHLPAVALSKIGADRRNKLIAMLFDEARTKREESALWYSASRLAPVLSKAQVSALVTEALAPTIGETFLEALPTLAPLLSQAEAMRVWVASKVFPSSRQRFQVGLWLLPQLATHIDVVPELRRILLDHVWQLRTADRVAIFDLVSDTAVMRQPLVDEQTFARIAAHLIDICGTWRWP